MQMTIQVSTEQITPVNLLPRKFVKMPVGIGKLAATHKNEEQS
jgi:hypothetical protein